MLPKTLRHKAKYLLHSLKNVDWNDRQELIYNGKVSKGSNKYDLLKYATEVKHTKFMTRHTPYGWNEFKDIIAKSNIPNTLLGFAVLDEGAGKVQEDQNPFKNWISLDSSVKCTKKRKMTMKYPRRNIKRLAVV